MAAWFCSSGCSSQPQATRTHRAKRADGPDSTLTAALILKDFKKDAVVVNVSKDPVYGGAHAFKAISLTVLLKESGLGGSASSNEAEVVINCTDGYKAILSPRLALDGAGFLAFSDSVSDDHIDFSPANTESGQVDPGPLYLVWTNSSAADRPWPYKIENLTLCAKGATLAAAEPATSSALVEKGFDLFCKNCATCHAINGAGGRVAVDLNVPLNVTEYWKEPPLRRLIHNASSVRANAKMPAFPNLTRADVDAIVAYLREMRGQKLVNP